jgi:hypothetical protein
MLGQIVTLIEVNFLVYSKIPSPPVTFLYLERSCSPSDGDYRWSTHSGQDSCSRQQRCTGTKTLGTPWKPSNTGVGNDL